MSFYKYTIILSILFLYQKNLAQELTGKNLIGEWKFIELQDKDGKKQTRIPLNRWQKNLIEKVNRDSYIFHENGKYTSINPLKSSIGNWYFDESTNEINLELRIDPQDPAIESLKKHKLIKKREDGFYYQEAVKKLVLNYSKNSMVIKDRDEYILIYLRVGYNGTD